MKGGFRGFSRRRLSGIAACLAVAAGSFAAPVGASGAATAADGPCPEAMPVSSLQPGMSGFGLTVSSGKTPEQFGVKILGVLKDGILPGRDMIIVDTFGPAIERSGGAWAGMSGSPVYIDNKFVGAFAWGLSFGPSTIGGLTPAEDMLDLMDLPSGAEPAATSPMAKAALTDSLREKIARSEGVATSAVGGSMVSLKFPLSVSGINARGMERLQQVIEKEKLPFIPYAGSSASATTAAAAPPVPGGNFAAALSYGDVTIAGVGTTTLVCEGKALAFGHYFNLGGAVQYGASDAEAIAIVDESLGAPYKLATIGGSFGTLDQDRFAGIRTVLGEGPTVIPVTSSVLSKDNLRSRDGRTDVLDSELVPFLFFNHAFLNIDSTLDRIGEGSSSLTWTINGTRESGEPWQLTRSNLYASEFDISFESLFEAEEQLFRLFFNRFEEVEFTGVDVDIEVEDAVKSYTIENVVTSVDGGPFKKGRIRAFPGSHLRLRVTLQPFDESPARVVNMDLQISPRARRDGFIELSAGQFVDDGFVCFLNGEECAKGSKNVDGFDELLQRLQNRPQNNELAASMRLGRIRGGDLETLDQVVLGFKFIRVRLIGGGCCGGVPLG